MQTRRTALSLPSDCPSRPAHSASLYLMRGSRGTGTRWHGSCRLLPDVNSSRKGDQEMTQTATETAPRTDPLGVAEAVPRRVLIVEDNAACRDTLRQLVKLWGFEVEVAEDGLQGVE